MTHKRVPSEVNVCSDAMLLVSLLACAQRCRRPNERGAHRHRRRVRATTCVLRRRRRHETDPTLAKLTRCTSRRRRPSTTRAPNDAASAPSRRRLPNADKWPTNNCRAITPILCVDRRALLPLMPSTVARDEIDVVRRAAGLADARTALCRSCGHFAIRLTSHRCSRAIFNAVQYSLK